MVRALEGLRRRRARGSSGTPNATDRRRRVLIIVQNLPVPMDRRVWQECQALVAHGIGVSVICPKGPGDPARQEIDGVRLYKYDAAPTAKGFAGYAMEFAYSWIRTALLSVVVAFRDGFDAIQACNPPDTYWALGRLWKLAGKHFVYDQHDLNPEVFLSRFGAPKGLAGRAQLAVLRWLEQRTYRTADHVISTNESYRDIAIGRGKCDPDHVTVVRSGPDSSRMTRIEPTPSLRNGRPYLAVYLGIMGPQDGVDRTLRALSVLVNKHGRTDCSLALLGFGDMLEPLQQLSRELGLQEYVTFTGRVGPGAIASYFSSAHLGLCPDPKTPLNDVSTMNKTMEYMAYELPVLTFDLKETRVSAGQAAVYVPSDDIEAFAAAWNQLLDDQAERLRLGQLGRERLVAELDWAPQSQRYVNVWCDVLGLPAPIDSLTADCAVTLDMSTIREPEVVVPVSAGGTVLLKPDLAAGSASGQDTTAAV